MLKNRRLRLFVPLLVMVVILAACGDAGEDTTTGEPADAAASPGDDDPQLHSHALPGLV